VPALIPQEHGGALLAGGVPGNAGGPGRPKSEIREALARAVDEEGVPFIRDVLGGVVRVRLVATCEYCGKEPSARLSADDVLKVAPGVGDRVARSTRPRSTASGP
jgi:hypothetical protein